MIYVTVKPQKESKVMQTLYLSKDQNKELVSAIGANAVLVFTHYIALAHQPVPNMEDYHVAELTGLSEQVVKRTRLSLTKLGWFLRIKDTYNGEYKYTYLVGKEAVKSRYRAALRVKTTKDKPSKSALENQLVKYFGLPDWDAVRSTKSDDEIIDAMTDLDKGITVEESSNG